MNGRKNGRERTREGERGTSVNGGKELREGHKND